MVIKRIAPLSLARISAAVYAAIGLLFGLMLAALSAVGALGAFAQPGSTDSADPLFALLGMGFAGLFLLPLFYGGLGLISGLVGAVLYNVFAGMVGGIEIETA